MANAYVIKRYDQSYLYDMNSKSYNEVLINFVIQSDRLNLNSDECKDLVYQIKKRCSNHALINFILDNDKIKILLNKNNQNVPKALKVVPMKDIKERLNEYSIFIDLAECVGYNPNMGIYTTNKIDTMIAYFNAAKTMYDYLYKNNYTLSVSKNTVMLYTRLFANVLDSLYKITITPLTRDECYYYISKFYMINVLGLNYKDYKDMINSMCKNISGLSDSKISSLEYKINDNDFINIDTFIKSMEKIFSFKGLKTSNFVEKWIQLYGPSTILAVELYPVLALNTITAFHGVYDNNQRLIEKIIPVEMIEFNRAI